jgi:hypothetical protein
VIEQPEPHALRSFHHNTNHDVPVGISTSNRVEVQAPLGLVVDEGPPQLQPPILHLHFLLEHLDVGGTRKGRRGKMYF